MLVTFIFRTTLVLGRSVVIFEWHLSRNIALIHDLNIDQIHDLDSIITYFVTLPLFRTAL